MNGIGWALASAPRTLLETSLHGSVLIGLILLIRLLLGRWLTPGFHLALWSLAGLRLLVPVSPPSGFSLFNLFAGAPDSPLAISSSGDAPLPVPSLIAAATASVESGPGISSSLVSQGFVLVWLAGALAILSHALLSQMRTGRWIAGLPPCRDARLFELLRRARAETGVTRKLAVVENPRFPAVAVFGRFCPTHLLVPSGFASDYPETEALGILRHELEHVRRNDLCGNWVALFIQAVHWFNPLVWLAGRIYQSDRELACDRAALRRAGSEERRCYGAALLRALEVSCSGAAIASLVPFTSRKSNLKHRLIMIKKPQNLHPLAQAVAIGLACAAAAATFTSAVADQPGSARPEASAGPAASPEGRTLTVRLDGNGAVTVNGTTLSQDRLLEGLQRATAGNPNLNVLLSAAPGTPIQSVAGLLAAMEKAGIRNVSLASSGARDGEGPAKPGPKDGEGARPAGPRDGEGPAKPGPKDDPNAPKAERGDAAPAGGQALLKTKEGKVFLTYDKDKSGGVTPEEVAAMREGELSRRDLRQLEDVFQELDSDGKPKELSVEEFVRWRQSGSPMGKSRG